MKSYKAMGNIAVENIEQETMTLVCIKYILSALWWLKSLLLAVAKNDLYY